MKASEDEFGHVRAVKEHSVEVLKRYFYKHSNGVTTSSGSRTDQSWAKAAEPGAKALKDFENKEHRVKIENPMCVQLCVRVRVLRDGERLFEKKVNEVRDRAAHLGKDKSRAAGKMLLDKAADQMDELVRLSREFLVKVEDVSTDSEEKDIVAMIKQVNSCIDDMSHHKDAIKLVLQQHK